MTAIAAASMRCLTLADGSLRIECEVEPRDAIRAFTLFSAPGTPMALAALKVGTQIDPEPEPEQAHYHPKGGQLAKWAAMRCQDERFMKWMRVKNEQAAREEILLVCRIRSLAELDSNPEAAGLFARHFRKPWHDHCQRNGWAD